MRKKIFQLLSTQIIVQVAQRFDRILIAAVHAAAFLLGAVKGSRRRPGIHPTVRHAKRQNIPAI